MYKPLADSTLHSMTKKEIIELLRMAERNAKVLQEHVEQQAENFKDWVPVVRCKDCEWFMREHGCPIEASGYHRGGRSLPVENDFCSYGERKDGGAEDD